MSITVTKLTIECVDEKGKRFKRVLEGKDAQEWYENNILLTMFAEEHKMNPKWHELNWKQTDIKVKPRKEYKNAILLEDILEREFEKDSDK